MDVTGKTSQQVIKESNLKLVFGLIDKNEPISRADIKKITKLSATTVSSLVEELINDNLVNEVGTKKMLTSGRKAILLKVNPNGGCFAGVEILKSAIAVDVYDLRFHCIQHGLEKINKFDMLERKVEEAVSKALNKVRYKLLGITIGVAGVIDSKENKVISSTVIDISSESDIVGTLQNAFHGVAVYLRNNSSLTAYAEKEFDKGCCAGNLISIDIDDGVGAGIVISGKIYGGTNGLAGEFGHISIDYNGEKCKCGSRGCLELLVSIPAVLKKAGIILGKQNITLTDIVAELQRNNLEIKKMIEEVALALSFGINNIINVIDPKVIVISGGIKQLGDYLLTPLRDYLIEKTLLKKLNIRYSGIEKNTVTSGGAKYAFDMLF